MTGLADRVVRGAVAFMAATTVAATVVGFWLSYAGLHAFARRSGLHGAEAWAWPASVDLFIIAGELGLTIAAVSRRRDPMAWLYLLAGFGPSVAFNVLHVVTVAPGWGRYAVAAVPPVAAMLALAALMRQVYRLAVEAHSASATAPEPEFVAVPSSVIEAATASMRATLAAGNPWSVNQIQGQFSLTRAQATKVRSAVLAEANGHATDEAPIAEGGDR